MKRINNTIIIGVDHGFGNIKHASGSFRAGLIEYDDKPTFTTNLLIYEDKYYLIGEGHKEFTADKFLDPDYYILTLAAIAAELRTEHITTARVHLAAGLPLTWVGEQRQAFRDYLLQHETVNFSFNRIDYHIEFVGADVFPQGFSAVADKLYMFRGTNMLCDIGNGTVNVMYINDRKPDPQRCFTAKHGVHQCVMNIKENVLRRHHIALMDSAIENALINGGEDLPADVFETIRGIAREYINELFRILREHEYDPVMMKLYIVGGGGCLIKRFGQYDRNKVFINTDICATAKGYEYLSAKSAERRSVC